MSKLDIKFKRLTPFKRCVLQNFPFIEEDFDALTNYGLLCKVVAYLNKVIASQNEVQGVTEEIVTAFNNLYDYVKNFFDNLDVQEEINNKLDSMVESGTLQEIIGAYLNATAIWGFDNVADMKSSSNLINGSYAKTLGFYSKNDGGAALYKIRQVTNDDVIDNKFIIGMNDDENELVAELITGNSVNADQVGLISSNDLTTDIQYVIDYSITNDKVINFNNKTYKITSIDFKNSKLCFNNSVFKAIGESTDVAITITNAEKCAKYSGFNIDGNGGIGLEIKSAKNLDISDVKISNCNTGIKATSGYELYIHDSLINNSSDIANSVGIEIAIDDSNFADIVVQGFRTGVKTTSWCIGNYYERLHIWSIDPDTVKNSVGFDIYDSANIENCVIDTCLNGIKVNRNGRINVIGTRWFWNTEYYNDTIVENNPTHLFNFDSANTTVNCYVRDCYCFKPSGTSVLLFSNLEIEDWKSLCDVESDNPNFSGVAKKPYGYITSFTTPESLTDSLNKIVATEHGVAIDYVGKIAADAQTGDLNIGILEDKCRPKYSINNFAAFGSQWDNPDGVCYLYINSGGAVALKINSSMLNKYVKIHFVIPR